MMTKQAELKKQAYASSLKSRALSILIYLIDRSNKDLTCFPAIPTMAEQLHISVSTVKRALHELVDAGYIEKDARFRDKNRGQTSNLYTLVLQENTSVPVEGAMPIVSSSIGIGNSEAENKKTEKKSGERVACTVEHITFADLKAESEQEEKSKTLSLCKIENNIVGEVKPEGKDRLIETGQGGKMLPAQSPCTMKLSGSKQKYYFPKPLYLPDRQPMLPAFFLWTGVGFNLQPP